MSDRPRGMATSGCLDDLLTRLERNEFLSALRKAGGQRSLAARRLGISRTKFYRRLEALGIDLHRSLIDQVEPTPVEATSEVGMEEARTNQQLRESLADLERREILNALRRTGGHRTLTAKALGISRSRLYRRVEALGIDLGMKV